MKSIIPYEKDVVFDTKIAEITSISLEHEEEIKNQELEGSFIVSGDYKVHNISVNKSDFSYKIPYTIELNDNIDKDSVLIDINDFTYDIKDGNTLVVKIELTLNYEEIKQEEKEEVEILDDNEENEARQEESVEVEEVSENQEVEEQETNTIIEKTLNNSENTYVTYHVYVVAQEDTLETICQKFNVSKETLHTFNEFEEIKMGDKLLIPLEDE